MPKPYIEDNGNLVYKIEKIRKDMIRTGITEGLTSKKTIALSQLLDYYVMQYQQQDTKSYNKVLQ